MHTLSQEHILSIRFWRADPAGVAETIMLIGIKRYHSASRFTEKTVRIIHLGDAGLGGSQNWICSLAEAQARRGFEVHLMQPRWVAAQEDEI